MKLTLRLRILLTLVPLLVLLTVLGGTGVLLLRRLGNRIEVILKENYASVIYMKDLNEALERIDSSFLITVASNEPEGRRQYEEYWNFYSQNLEWEQNNITLPGEADLVAELTALSEAYRREGAVFFATLDPDQRRRLYGAKVEGGLWHTFQKIKKVSDSIRQINQDNMEQADRDARATARSSLVWFGGGLVFATILAGLLALHTIRTVLQPIQAVTDSAQAISAGLLDQVVPVMSRDELGQLADAFNTMARQLRGYRESRQAQLLRVQQASQATIDSFPHPVLLLDNEGRVDLANPAARRLFGVLAEVGAPKPAVAWLPPDPLREPLAAALREQRAYLPEGFDQAIALGPVEQDRVFLPRILPVRDPLGNTLGAAVMLEDVTRFRLLDQVKSNLVATVSHELKTPLTSLRLAIHLLLEETVGPLTPKQLELLLDARDNTERLLAMINNLLDLARMEGGARRLDVVPEQPAMLLQAAADFVRPRAEDKGVTVAVEVPAVLPPVLVDPRQIGHALQNLLDNALTYTPAGGRITLSAHAADGAVVLGVADTGVGIPSEYVTHVFDKFFRVPGQSQAGGTGLGLAIVREIVTAHGGTVLCESHPGEGTRFHLSLPAQAAVPPHGGST